MTTPNHLKPAGRITGFIARRTRWRLRGWIAGTVLLMAGCAGSVIGLWTGVATPRWIATGYLVLLFMFCWDQVDRLRAEARQAAVRERVQAAAIRYVDEGRDRCARPGGNRRLHANGMHPAGPGQRTRDAR